MNVKSILAAAVLAAVALTGCVEATAGPASVASVTTENCPLVQPGSFFEKPDGEVFGVLVDCVFSAEGHRFRFIMLDRTLRPIGGHGIDGVEAIGLGFHRWRLSLRLPEADGPAEGWPVGAGNLAT